MGMPPTGHREVEHTADWELEVWAPDLPGLLAEAARGMYRLMGVELADGPRRRRHLHLEPADREVLLVQFLGELLYLGESDDVAFDTFDLSLAGGGLTADLEGAPVLGRSKEIKAVTFHRLEVHEGPSGLATRIVFDV